MTMDFVMSRIVKSPVTSKALSPRGATWRLTNVRVGKRSVEKKSSERRCASRSATPVSMLAALISMAIDEAAGCCSSKVMVPLKSAKRPRTFESR